MVFTVFWALLAKKGSSSWAPGSVGLPEASRERFWSDFGSPDPSKNNEKCCTVIKNQGFRDFSPGTNKFPKKHQIEAQRLPQESPEGPKSAPGSPKVRSRTAREAQKGAQAAPGEGPGDQNASQNRYPKKVTKRMRKGGSTVRILSNFHLNFHKTRHQQSMQKSMSFSDVEKVAQ